MNGDYLIVVDDDVTEFRFAEQSIIRALVERWPTAEVVLGPPVPGAQVSATIYLPSERVRKPEIRVFEGGGAVGVEIYDNDLAVEVVALLCATQPIPDNNGVVIIHWASGLVPLRPGMTEEELLSLAAPA